MPDQLITDTDVKPINTGAASGFASSDNPHVRSLGGDKIRPVEYYVGLYSVNRRKMADSPFSFIVEGGVYKTVAIPTCPADKPYIKVMDIPHPVQSVEADPHQFNETVVRIQRAEFVAMNIVNPDVFGTSMDHLPPQSALAKYSISSRECDLIRQGVFFTRAEEGTPAFEKALKAAEARRDAYYRNILSGLQGMSDSNIQQVLGSSQGLDIRTAAEHFGEEYSWMRSRRVKVDCPNCFEKIPQGAAFHKNELLGTICVIDWVRTVEAGVKKIEDVPPSKWHLFPELSAGEDADDDDVSDGDEQRDENTGEDSGAEQVQRGRGRPKGTTKAKKAR